MSDEHSRILNLFLREQEKKQIKVLEKGKEYQFLYPEHDGTGVFQEVRIILTNDLVYRVKKVPGKKTLLPRYSVIGNGMLADGAFAGVYPVAGTLVPRRSGKMLYKTHKRRVVKVQNHNSEWPSTYALKEAELSRRVPYLHAKDAVVYANIYGRESSYIVEKMLPGETLFRILSHESGPPEIDVDKRLQLSINLVLALAVLHACGIVHRDLKTQNVMVDMTTCEVHIIDMGLSRKAEEEDHHYFGNMAYKAPEAVTRKYSYNQLSDVYSMGLILAELWNAVPRDSAPWHTKEYVTNELLNEREVANLDTLFAGLSGIDADHAAALGHVIRGMVAINPKERIALPDALQTMEKIKWQRKLNALSEHDRLQIRLAYVVAKDTRIRLARVEATPDGSALSLIVSTIGAALDKIADTEQVLKEFIEASGLTFLRGLKNRAAAKARVSEVTDAFADHVKELQAIRDLQVNNIYRVDEEVSELVDDIEMCIEKCNRCYGKLNDMAAANGRLASEIQRLKSVMPEYRVTFYPDEQASAKKAVSTLIPVCDSAERIDDMNIRVSSMKSSFFNSRICNSVVNIIEDYPVRQQPARK